MTTTVLDPTRGDVRAIRAAVLALPTVGLAAVGHGLAAGCLSGFGLFVAIGLAWPAAVWALARRRTTASLLAWGLGVQLGAHVVLDLLCENGESWTGFQAHLVETVTTSMLVFHTVTSFVVGVALARADAGLWAARAVVRGLSRLRLPRRVRRLTVAPAPQPMWRGEPTALLSSLRDASVPRRGPPQVCPSR